MWYAETVKNIDLCRWKVKEINMALIPEEKLRALDAPMFLSRVGWTSHPPTYDASGRFRYGFPETDAFVELCERFARAGVKTF